MLMLNLGLPCKTFFLKNKVFRTRGKKAQKRRILRIEKALQGTDFKT